MVRLNPVLGEFSTVSISAFRIEKGRPPWMLSHLGRSFKIEKGFKPFIDIFDLEVRRDKLHVVL